MLLGTISTLFSILGIYGYFASNDLLLYVGFLITILEIAIGYIKGELKSLITYIPIVILAIVIACTFSLKIIPTIAMFICLESVINYILGFVLLFYASYKIQKQSDSPFTDISDMVSKGLLPNDIGRLIYDVLIDFSINNKKTGYYVIESQIIPLLIHYNNNQYTLLCFHTLINKQVLSEDEASTYIKQIKEFNFKK